MLSTVFRISFKPEVENDQVDGFLEKLCVPPSCRWEKGSARFDGRIYEASGCNVCVSDSENLEEIIVDILAFLAANPFLQEPDSASLLSSLSEIDIGLTVGGNVHFTRYAKFPPEFLKEFAEFGIALNISCYPCCDDDGEETSEVPANANENV